ncbi:MAG: Ig-like domain-containing protein, partial [Bacteroidota bacterium]|nr:Ig-like domain-containing protein [Bacteroidota bacterium]
MNTEFSRAKARRPEACDSTSVMSAVRIFRWLLLLLVLLPEIVLAQQPVVVPRTLSVNEGEVVSVTVYLDVAPTSTVTFRFHGLSGLSADPSDLTFTATDYNEPQTVRLTAAEDNDTNDLGPHFVGGLTDRLYPRILAVFIYDNDKGTPALQLDPQALAVDEGSSSTYRVRLSQQPSASVAVAITGQAGTDLMLDEDDLTFTTSDWDDYQTVTVMAGQDDDRDEDVVTLRHTASDGGYDNVIGNVIVTVTDIVFPTVEITGVPARINSTTAFTAAFVFSEAVTGFDDDDITVTGGTKGAFSGSGTTYMLVVTPDGSADVVVTVAANSATNGEGNDGPPSAVSATATWDADPPPTLAISGVPARINTTTSFTATFTFSEPVIGFGATDITVTGGTGIWRGGRFSSYWMVVTPTGSADVVVTVAANTVRDFGGNTGPASAVSATATWDTTIPTVEITDVPTTINSTDPFTATFTYSEAVTGFDATDITITGGTGGTFTAINATTYTLDVTPSGSADVVVTVAAYAATDGLYHGPDRAVTATATWDAAAPTVRIN